MNARIGPLEMTWRRLAGRAGLVKQP